MSDWDNFDNLHHSQSGDDDKHEDIRDFYAWLKVRPDAPLIEIREALKRERLKAKRLRINSPSEAADLNELRGYALRVFKDDTTRAEYDKKLAASRQRSTSKSISNELDWLRNDDFDDDFGGFSFDDDNTTPQQNTKPRTNAHPNSDEPDWLADPIDTSESSQQKMSSKSTSQPNTSKKVNELPDWLKLDGYDDKASASSISSQSTPESASLSTTSQHYVPASSSSSRPKITNPKIFISYRRDDSQYVTDSLYGQMISHFDKEDVFLDVGSIPFGVDFRQFLNDQIAAHDVVLVMIGRDWGRIMQERASHPNDFVRIEIENALQQNKLIIPVLVKGASMPDFSQLPNSIADLQWRNSAIVRRNPDLESDCAKLASGIKSFFKNQ